MRQNQLSLLILCVLNVNLYDVTGFQLGVVAEFRGGDDTIALVADVDDYFFLVDADDLTVNDLMLADLVKGLVVRFVKLLLADISGRAILVLFPVKVL